MSTSFRLPLGYNGAPPWPSLYWPFSPDFVPLNLIADVPHSLFYLNGKAIALLFISFDLSLCSIIPLYRYMEIHCLMVNYIRTCRLSTSW